MQQGEGRIPSIVGLSDSPDARLFVELSSYGADLHEASAALDLAVRLKDEQGQGGDAIPYLIGFAAVAYCRTLIHSNVRRPLMQVLEIPSELLRISETIKTFRNATIAHSQSDLSVTYAVGVLDPVTLAVQFVGAATVVNTLPWSVINDFRTLVALVETELDKTIAPVRARLEANLGEADRAAMVATTGNRAAVLHKFADQFNPKTTRPAYPTSHPVYWSQETTP